MLAMIAGTSLSAVFLVLQGHKTWRDAGSHVAQFAALEIEPEEARRIANLKLLPLPK